MRFRFAVPAGLAIAAFTAVAKADTPLVQTSQPVPNVELDSLQYGAAFTAETRVASGGACPKGEAVPCILNSGGGIALRVGHRSQRGLYLGGAYEFSKHDSSNLLNLAILQQLRGEIRRYLTSGERMAPYALGGLGLAGYGNEWSVDTWGGVVNVGIGVEYEVTREVFIGLAPAYRVFVLRGWHDKAGQDRPGGIAQFLGLELTLEVRSVFERW
jgi:opacity protein-like surface antigen